MGVLDAWEMLLPSLTPGFCSWDQRPGIIWIKEKRDREEILSKVCLLQTNALRRLYILIGKSRALIHFRMCFLSWSESYVAQWLKGISAPTHTWVGLRIRGRGVFLLFLLYVFFPHRAKVNCGSIKYCKITNTEAFLQITRKPLPPACSVCTWEQ